ncbi:MAG: Asp23/Gls24 family envelope stress response protein [Anaerovoracaceae bacterium]|nr:Asp23/Gls24 family envelope stress response protein [Anaerovoracaceae bacterium]
MAGTGNDKQTINRVSEEIVSMIAARAALRVSGVSRLNGEFTDQLTKKILGKENIARGIALTREEEGLGIDIYLNVEFGARIPDLAWEVQSSVKEAVESVTGLAVQMVNIHVQGVNLQKDLSQER